MNVLTTVFEDNFDRPGATGAVADAAVQLGTGDGGKLDLRKLDGSAAEASAGDAAYGDATAAALQQLAQLTGQSEPSNLGPNWTVTRGGNWRIEDGKLCGQNSRNHGVWLNKVLPVNARIEFDAISYSPEGDLKCEVWGDGASAATSVSYTNATSYLAILGGWKNTLHVLARIDEHGADRKEIRVDKTSDDPRQRPVVPGQTYHFKIERTDGKTVRFFVDGLEYAAYADPNPLMGVGHDHFGFNEWQVKVCFDNVKITPL
jgi:hypothetical protein